MNSVRHLCLFVASLIFLIATGTIGCAGIKGWHPFDLLYMTFVTLSTAGFGQVQTLNHENRILTIILILQGDRPTIDPSEKTATGATI